MKKNKTHSLKENIECPLNKDNNILFMTLQLSTSKYQLIFLNYYILVAMETQIPLESLEAKRKWRDEQLAGLAVHKMNMSKKESKETTQCVHQ